jgi:hypothetical protein
METCEGIQSMGSTEHLEEHGAAGSSRRDFVRQVAAAGVGSAALAVLLGAKGAQKAEAKVAGEMIRSDTYTFEVIGGRFIRAQNDANPAGSNIQEIQPNGAAEFHFPINGFDVQSKAVYGVWYTAFDHIQNLTQFSTIDLALNADRTGLVVNVRPVPGVQSTILTIQAFVLHEPI